MKKEILKKAVTIATATAAALAPLAFNMPMTQAAGVTLSSSVTEIAAAGATDVTISWTATNAVEAAGTTYSFTVATIEPLQSATLDEASVADGFIDGNGTDGAGALTGGPGSTVVFTTTTATVSTARSLSLEITPTDMGSYSVSMVSSTGDYGSVLIHVEDNNDVYVTADIAPSLSFNIRDLLDTTDTNVCDLGTISTSTDPNGDLTDDGMGECGYGLAVGTNAEDGVVVSIDAVAEMQNADDSVTINDITEDTAFGQGVEAYGLDNVTAAQTGRDTINNDGTFDVGLTEAGTFATDSSQVPTASTSFITYDDGIFYSASASPTGGANDETDLTRVMHGMTVSSGTPAGAYDQTVTYTVTATF